MGALLFNAGVLMYPVKLYRGEGVALLAFDLDPAQATDDFVGVTVEVRYPGSDNWGVLRNRLHFDYPPNLERPRSFRSTAAPSRSSAGSTCRRRSIRVSSATA